MPRARAVLVAVVAALALAGCTGAGSGSTPTPTAAPAPPSTSVAPTPSPTVDLRVPPERPAAMDEPTTDGAIAAATYVLDVYTYSFVTGDTEPWRALALETCEFCTSVVDGVAEMHEAGHSSTGGPFSVTKAWSQEISEDRWFAVDLTATQEPSSRVDAEGATVAENPGGLFSVVFALSWADQWRIDEMGFERIEAGDS